MTEAARHIIDEALKLKVAERAEVAAELLASLDGEPEADIEKAWADEIQRRIERIRNGTAKGRPWSEVRSDLERRRG